jgi:predicted SAM-dependent methyltransferase
MTKFNLEAIVKSLYESSLGRTAGDSEVAHWQARYDGGGALKDLISEIINSSEASNRSRRGRGLSEMLHESRKMLVRGLPRARCIVDLGGGAIDDPRGALVVMGYPYGFESLTIVEPKAADRHPIYAQVSAETGVIATPRGPVSYHFGSMDDLVGIEDASVDLVFSGETIEHVTVRQAEVMLHEVDRVLKRGGSFCFDTPNRLITRLHVGREYTNPDHKIEYTPTETLRLISNSGLRIEAVKGVHHMPETAESGQFNIADFWDENNVGVFDDYDACYLTYVHSVKD